MPGIRGSGEYVQVFYKFFFNVLLMFCIFHHHYLMQGIVFMLFILISLFNARFHSHLISLSKIVFLVINKFVHFYK